MQYKVFNYELWQDKSSGTYYTRFNGITVEITREVYYELMSHENADRYAEQSDKARIRQLCEDTAWLMVRDIADEIVDKIELKELLACYAEIDRIIILHYLTRERFYE